MACTAALADPARPMSFRHLTVADGLSQSTVMDVVQDSYGYIWFATENGLDRYDGHEVHRYQRGQASAGELSSDYVWQIAEDAAANLWLATEGGGVAIWDRSTDRFTHLRHDPDDPATLSSDRTRTILLTTDAAWVGTQDGGLNRIDRQTGAVERMLHDPDDPTSLPSDAVFSLLQDSDGRIWVGTDTGLAWLEPGTRRFKRLQHDPKDPQSLSSDRVRALYQDRHSVIWVGTFGGGLNLLNPRTGRFTRYSADPTDPGSLSNDHVRDIFEDDEGRLWVGTADGLNVMLPRQDHFWRYRAGERSGELADGYVMSIFQDRGGVLWVGTRTGGVASWNSRSWELGHYQAPWLRQRSTTAFASDDGGFWVGTFGGGLTRVDELADTVTHFNTGTTPALTDDRVMSLLRDREGGLWIGTMGGGVHWLAQGATTFRVLRHDPDDPESVPADSAMSLFQDSLGQIWIGTFGSGVIRYDPLSGGYRSFHPAPADGSSLCGTQGRAFAEDSTGLLWVATENGLCVFDRGTEQFQSLRHREDDPTSLAADSIYALHLDAQNTLWIGTGGGGLSKLVGSSATPDGVRFQTYSRRDGLSSNMIYGVLSDDSGHLWLSGNNGLTRFDPNAEEVRNYHRTHGLQGDEFHFGASHRADDGRLFFGGANGFNLFDPAALSEPAKPPPVVLTSVAKMNQPIDPDGPLAAFQVLELGYDESAATFEFSALDFTEPEANRYAYKLEGLDPDWIEAGNRRSVTYTNLAGGEYLFRVKAAGSAGAWNERGLAVRLRVAPAPWNTSAAYAIYAGTFVMLLWLYVARQRRQQARDAEYRRLLEVEVAQRTEELEQRNAELGELSRVKSDFLARMSHEIRSPMNGILGMAELLARSPLTAQQRKFTQTITSSGGSLLQIINDILDFSKLESGKIELDPTDIDLEELLDETLEMFALEAWKKGLALVGAFPPEGLPRMKVDALRLRQVLVNLLSNALKFTQHGHVKLTAEAVPSQGNRLTVRLSVTDTGIGIAPENHQRVFESFSQEDGSTTRRFGGTGLGLSICRELVTLMGGHLSLDSAPGHGTTFAFEIAVERSDPQHLEQRAPAVSGHALIAISDEALQQQVRTYLSSWGMRCEVTPTAQAAIEMLGTTPHRATDLLVVDDQLSDISGVQLIESLRNAGQAPTGGTILLRPFGADDTTLDHGGLHGLSEPLKRRELLKAVSHVLKEGHPAEGSEERSGQHVNPEAAAELPLLNGSVLLVEDNPVNQEVIAGMLVELGCGITFAADGGSGVRLAAEEHFDAVLMDYQLPDIDGVEATRRIRAARAENPPPIIALTANASLEDQQRCLRAGMVGFLAKPCSLSDLADALSRWLPEKELRVDPLRPMAKDGVFDELALARIRRLSRPDGSSMLQHAVEVFLRSTDEMLEAMERAIDSADAEALRFAAHKLKSGCANLGALAMSDLCRQLEDLGRAGTLQDARAILDRLIAQKPAVSSWLTEQLNESA